MAINLDLAIQHMRDLKAKGVRYSMDIYKSRTGADGWGDCSGTIYSALRKAGASDAGWVLNTDHMHSWLEDNGFKLIAHNRTWSAKKGDIVIFGPKGASGGSAGHVVMFTDPRTVIHCTWLSSSANGIYEEPEQNIINRGTYNMGWYTYRLTNPVSYKPVDDQVVQDVLANKYGVGEDRRNALRQQGYDPDEVQKAVNAKLAEPQEEAIEGWAKITAGQYSLDTRPWGEDGYQTIMWDVQDYVGEVVKYTRRKGGYYFVELPDDLKGWLDHRALELKDSWIEHSFTQYQLVVLNPGATYWWGIRYADDNWSGEGDNMSIDPALHGRIYCLEWVSPDDNSLWLGLIGKDGQVGTARYQVAPWDISHASEEDIKTDGRLPEGEFTLEGKRYVIKEK